MEDNPHSEKNYSAIPINIPDSIHLQESLRDSPKNNNLKKSTRAKPLTRTVLAQQKLEEYSLDEPGTIERAEKHREANRPLHVVGEINEKVNFCRCCDFPLEEKGIIEPFKMCDSADIFAEFGVGISLYFFFFKFIILITFLGVLCLSILLMILNMDYSKGIKDVCNSKYKNANMSDIGNCYGYVTESDKKENYYTMFNQWMQRFSSDCIFIYRRLPLLLRGNLNNKVYDVLVNYSLVNFIFLITTFILNILFLILIRAQIKRLRLNNITIRDYTVLISNANKIITDYHIQSNNNKFNFRESQIEVERQDDFKRYVEEYIKGDKKLYDIKIEQINICYNLHDYLKKMEKFEKAKRKIFQINNNQNIKTRNQEKHLYNEEMKYYYYPLSFLGIYCCAIEGESLRELKKTEDELDKQLNQEEDRIRGKITHEDFTDYMLISFNMIGDKEKFLDHQPNNFFGRIRFFFCNLNYFCPCFVDKKERRRFWLSKDIEVREPPEPEDIYWENFKYSRAQRFLYTFTTYLICLLIIIASFGLIFGLSYLQDRLYNDNKENGNSNIFLKYLTSLSITVLISIVNTLIQLVLGYLTLREKPISKSNYVLSLSIKISIFTFLNSAVVPLISKYIVVLKQENNENKKIDYWVSRKRDDLLIDDLFIYFLVNAIVTPILFIFNFSFWWKKLRICCITRKSKPTDPLNMSQKELNKLYEYPDIDLAYKLSYLVKTLSMCFFYMPIFPAGFIFSFIGFILAYWIDKYVFIHMCKRPDMLDQIIENFYANFFIVVLFIGSIGDYIFLHNAFDTNKWTLANIILFGVLIIVPYTKFVTCNYVDTQKTGYRYRPLTDVYFTFYNDYQRMNPLTKKLGLETYVGELKKKGYLTNNAYNIINDNIDKLNLMELYYGILENNAPLVQQSIIANVDTPNIQTMDNLRGTIIFPGELKSTIIRPELKDSPEEKMKKQKFLESQVHNMFGEGINHRRTETINEQINEVDEEHQKEINELEKKVVEELPISKSQFVTDITTTDINLKNE